MNIETENDNVVSASYKQNSQALYMPFVWLPITISHLIAIKTNDCLMF